MAFPQDMVYVRWEFGWRPSGASVDLEIQDFGLWGVYDVGGGVSFDWQTVVDTIAEQSAASWASSWPASQFTTAVKARRVVAYHYDQAHHLVLHRGEQAFDPDYTWSGSGDPLPPQLSVVVSTSAFNPAGFASESRNKRGRYYLPTPASSLVQSTGELSNGNRDAILEEAVDFHNSLTGALFNTNPAVPAATYWRPYVNSPTKVYANKISFLRVGQRIDTQRRRANALAENYATGPVNT